MTEHRAPLRTEYRRDDGGLAGRVKLAGHLSERLWEGVAWVLAARPEL